MFLQLFDMILSIMTIIILYGNPKPLCIIESVLSTTHISQQGFEKETALMNCITAMCAWKVSIYLKLHE